MIDSRIYFDEVWNRDDGTKILYFVAPKEMLEGKYPEAVSMEIMIELPTYIVSFSPTKYDEEEECYTDYDWFDVDMSCEEIEELIALAKQSEWYF